MKVAARRLSSARRSFHREVRSVQSHPSSASKSSIPRCSPVITNRQSIENRLTKNCRREQARKRKPLVQRLSQRLNLRLSGRNRRCSRRHWELSPLRFSPLSGRAAAFTIRLRLHWRKALCAPPAAKSAGKSLAGSSEESLAAVGDADSCSGVCVKRGV